MLGIKEELLKTDKNDVKVKFCRGGTIEDTEDNTKSIFKREPIMLSFMSEATTQQI